MQRECTGCQYYDPQGLCLENTPKNVCLAIHRIDGRSNAVSSSGVGVAIMNLFYGATRFLVINVTNSLVSRYNRKYVRRAFHRLVKSGLFGTIDGIHYGTADKIEWKVNRK